jgi:hypothetical protein
MLLTSLEIMLINSKSSVDKINPNPQEFVSNKNLSRAEFYVKYDIKKC